MADEPNMAEPIFVDPNTDDLDAFNQLMTGKAQVKPAEEVKEEKAATPPVEEETEDEGNEASEDEESADDDQTETEESKEEEKPKKKVNRFQERIDELTARAREAERREAEANRRIQEAEAKQKTPPTPVSDSKPVEPPAPDAKNQDGSEKYPLGEFDPAYIRDLTRHTIQTEQAAATERAEQERQTREATEAREQLHSQWTEKLSTVTETLPDFLDKTLTLETTFDGLDANYSDYLVQTIKSLDHGPEVLYYFANNLDEARRVVKAGPLGATLALGEINAKFKAAPAKEEPKTPPVKVSNAPTPPPVVNKGTKTRQSVMADTDDLDAFSDMFFKKKRRP